MNISYKLSSELSISKTTVHGHQHQLKRINSRCQEVSHELTQEMVER